MRESIVDPNAYIEKGFPNAMPPTFKDLPKDQLDALVSFLAQNSQKTSQASAKGG